VGAPQVERDAGRPDVRARHPHAQRRVAVQPADAPHPPDEDLVLVEQLLAGLDLGARAAHPVAQA
jgi:hypothetical protein